MDSTSKTITTICKNVDDQEVGIASIDYRYKIIASTALIRTIEQCGLRM